MYEILPIIVRVGFVLAQVDDSGDAGAGESAAFSMVNLVFSLISYVFGSFCLQKICEKIRVPNSWLAWVPFANLWLMYRAGEKSGWWVISLIIPLVNIVGLVVLIQAWITIFQKLGKNPWLLLLFLVPVVNLVFYGYLAFGS